MPDPIAVAAEFWNGLPEAFAAVVLLAAAWPAAVFIRFVVVRVLRAVRVDGGKRRSRLSEFLLKGNVAAPPSVLGGRLVFWLILGAAGVEALKTASPQLHAAVVRRLAAFLPDCLGALLIALLGGLAVVFVANFVRTVALNAGWPHPRFLAAAAKWTGAAAVAIAALGQLGIGGRTAEFLFQTLAAAGAAGIALAFGLGCQDLARDAARRFLADLRERGRDGSGPDLEG
jgi:hypothetical protein